MDSISSYDLVPYESYPFAHLHPARLAATAQLRGMPPPPVHTARVLDLGCGSGGHVIALAGFYPQMKLVGVDLAAGQIEQGNARIRELGLRNVSLHAGNLAVGLPEGALMSSQGFHHQFDYILCQGVYYVVPEAVRSGIWKLLQMHLAPSGIAHISFNTYPGWKLREVAQDFAQFHAAPESPGAAQEQRVREGLAQIAALSPLHAQGLTAGYGLSLRAEAQLASQSLPGLLFHEFLSGDNQPLYFQQMNQAAQAAGFFYLCEAGLPDAWPARVGVAGQPLYALAAGNALKFEQYLDFAMARTYRNSLWVRPEVANRVQNALNTWPDQALHGLQLPADLSLGQSGTDAQAAFLTAQGTSFQVPVAQAGILHALVKKPSQTLWMSATSLLDAFPDCAALLHECVLRGLVGAWHEPPSLSMLKPLEAPAWLRLEALRQASRYLPTIWHQAVGLSVQDRQLLAACDGQISAQSLMQRDASWQSKLVLFERQGWIRPAQ
ncbi:MAG: methyltransferase domain-containing protein [Brachymonas sp.]|nr:methyltransferase domain-containing protein [Brachymonas sp.]